MLRIDFTQHVKFQTRGKWAKALNVVPDKASQQELANSVQGLPMTSIVGSALVRHGSATCQFFDGTMGKSMPFAASIFVPIELPSSFEKFLKSAAKRALGPTGDSRERPGVEFQIRTIGCRGNPKDEADDDPDPADSEESEVEDDPGVIAASGVLDVPIDVMTPTQMRTAFGREALAMMGAMFQHQSKIGEQGKFLPQNKFVQVLKESGGKRIHRKSQVDPTVIYSALKSTLKASASALQPSDCFVQVCGGTPEPIVAAILMGFQNVFYITQAEKEAGWMKVPSKKDESLHNISYNDYQSPNLEAPDEGTMAAAAIKMLAPFIQNFVMETPGTLMVPSPVDIVKALVCAQFRVIAPFGACRSFCWFSSGSVWFCRFCKCFLAVSFATASRVAVQL